MMPTPKPTHRPTVQPTKPPVPQPTASPTASCHIAHANWQTQTTADKAGPVYFQVCRLVGGWVGGCLSDRLTVKSPAVTLN